LQRALAAAVAVLATIALLPAAPATAAPVDRFTPVAAEVIAAPEPVLASDGRRHLAYELLLINHSFPPAPVTLQRVEAIAGGEVVDSLSGRHLAAVTRPFGNSQSPLRLAGGEAATVLMDVSFPQGAKLPQRLTHRLVISQRPPSSVVATTYLAAPTSVSRRPALVVAPPLRGPDWVVGNGCCAEATSHRASVLAINGGLHAGERFAIDFFQIAPSGFLAEGPREDLSSYPYFGDEVLSATAGRVVTAVDGLPDVPVSLSLPPISAAEAGGNHVVVALGHHRFAFYAHLQPGSVRVRVGDRVSVGETLGLLGNSGNSNAPHLHFQLMNGPIPLGSNGIPFRFSRFAVTGTLRNFVPLFALGARAKVAPEARGRRRDELPLNLQVLNFK
jgi:hypothetical protein